MKEQLLFDDFPTKEQRLAAMTEEEKAAYILGLCCYDGETGNGKRVFLCEQLANMSCQN